MKRFALVFLAACTTQPASRETVTVVAPPDKKECPPGQVFNGVACAELLASAGSIDSGAPTGPVLAVDHANLTDEARDLRRLSQTPRSAALLVTEVQALESLKNASSTSSPDYPQIVRRLGEDYSELAYANGAEAKPATAARRKAIAEYSTLVASFPNYAQLDEVLYYLGYTYELDGDSTSARKTYYTLIQKYPNSKWIPYAYYSFGEAFAAEAKSDPSKWPLAQQAYQEVLKFAGSNILPWAYLRLGQAMQTQGDPRAAQMFAKLKAAYPQSKAAQEAP